MNDRLTADTHVKTRDGMDDLTEPKVFSELSDRHKRDVIQGVIKQQWKDGGMMGRLFGTDKEIASRNSAFTSVLLLIIVGIAASFSEDKQVWNIIIPAITTVIGYFFGKSS